MQVKVKYIATAREITGVREETIDIGNPSTISDLVRVLSEKHGPRMREYLLDPATGKPRPHLQFLLNEKSIHMMSAFDTALTDGSTVMIVPPVSGG